MIELFIAIASLFLFSEQPCTLDKYLTVVDSAFVRADTAQFNRMVPLADVQQYYAELIRKNFRREAGGHRVLWTNGDSALVLLTGLPRYGNSGDETSSAIHYSGVYRLQRVKGDWHILQRIPYERLNRIRAQHLGLEVRPGEGLSIRDTLTIDTRDTIGFMARLNHRAVIGSVLLDGKSVTYQLAGGLLWVASRISPHQHLVVTYTLAIEHDEKDVNSGYFGTVYGHVRNQYAWHPFFSYASPNDRADFVLRARLPRAYPLTTSLPQTERLEGDVRLITARSENPVFALALYYDKDWQVNRHHQLVIYATPDFEPSRDSLVRFFTATGALLNARFGAPRSTYLGIVQDRSAGGNGWKNRSNNTVITSAKGSYLITDRPRPRAVFGHEIAHGWTTPSGEATNWLSEGWATYCEADLLAARYSDTIIRPFFAAQRNNYLSGEYEGKASMSTDYNNGGVSYGKGAWLFYMLEQQLGRDKFDTALRRFIRSDEQTTGQMIRLLSEAAGYDMAPYIRPWLENKSIPSLKFRQQSDRLLLNQQGQLFRFPLTIRCRLKNGSTVDRIIQVTEREQQLEIPGLESFTPDPLGKLLWNSK